MRLRPTRGVFLCWCATAPCRRSAESDSQRRWTGPARRVPAAAGVTSIVVNLCGQPPYQDPLPSTFCLVEPGGLEPPDPLHANRVIGLRPVPDLVNGTSVVARGVPLVTVVYGTLMARRSWSSLPRWSAEPGVGRAHERAIVFGGRRIRPGEGIRHARLGVRGRPGGALALPGTTAISVTFPQVPCRLRRQSVGRADRVESG